MTFDAQAAFTRVLSLPIALFELRLPIAHAVKISRGLFSTRAHAAFHASLEERQVAALAPTRSAVQRWEFPSPWSLKGLALARHARGADLHAELVLFGSRAVEVREAALAALSDVVIDIGGTQHDTARAGVFRREVFVGPIAEWAARRASVVEPARGVAVELVAPFDTRGAPFDLAAATAGVALLLARWSLEDGGEDAQLGADGCKLFAEGVADAVRAIVNDAGVVADVRERAVTERTSSANGHRFPLRGWVGRAEVRGDATRGLPWLEALALRGGRHRKFGMSEVEVGRL